MPTVLIIGHYRFFFVSLDYSEPPHIHIQPGGFKPQEINKIGKLVQEN